MEEIQFNGEQRNENETPYVPYTPPLVKMITQGSSKPPLCKVGDGAGEPTVYSLNDGAYRLLAYVKMVQVDGDWEVETPLAMCRYVKPEGDLLFNAQACEDATRENARRRLHNKFLVDLFREFMPRYDCGASANKMTEPQPPPDFVQERRDKIKELRKDKLGTAQKAIEYLAKYEIYCGRDYKFEEAFDKASDKCFEMTIKERQERGKIRVRLEGRKPCWWDGISPEDESGCRVKWERGENHTFLTPDIRVVRDYSSTELIVLEEEQGLEEVAEKEENSFAALFPPPSPKLERDKGEEQLLIEEI